jgi:hypothetical protein
MWQPCTVKDILVNPTYAGFIRWSYRPTVKRMKDGQPVSVRPVNHEMPLIPGLHEPIIDRAAWEAAQEILRNRSRSPVPGGKEMLNPLSGLLICSRSAAA